MNLGEKLKQLRKQSNWTQPEAAEAIGIEQSYLSKLENTKSVPSSDVFEQILTAYKLDMESMLEGLSSKAKAQLKSLPQVSDHLGQVKKLSLQAYRNWLITAFILFSIGSFFFASGFFKVIPSKERFEYLSLGIVKVGERPDIFSNYKDYIRVMPKEEYLELELDILNRMQDERRFEQRDKGGSFQVNVDGGTRMFDRVRSKIVPSPINAWFKAIGSMFIAMSFGCLFIARVWK